MQILFESDIFFIRKMLNYGHFSFIYNKNEIEMGEKEFSEFGWTIYNFFYNKIIKIETQIHLQNFKISSQSHIDSDYSFCF